MESLAKEIMYQIMLQCTIPSLSSLLQCNKEMYSFSNEYLWKLRYERDFGQKLLDDGWYENYQYSYGARQVSLYWKYTMNLQKKILFNPYHSYPISTLFVLSSVGTIANNKYLLIYAAVK